ncbi:sialic acid-specific 9-O-acetylesterase [Lentisphaera araneosa HTCC2155]|uniref:Sialic acid-specific 9-O-acetylesterase n=1 Tax=Lentisphaera araneosa HTCC2155 TaxID=313628 RepID=A6DGC2_9BACT|nr:sialate O-acetylesterase [Lentisphaera araneosa]EDM29239.1 sialic acid-specific 9-O-acetylesterase [Lentisphaera araneosa HTCC2155]
MFKSKLSQALLLSASFLFQAQADITLPKIMDSQMVLQRNAKVPIWGWADQGEKVTVSFAGQTKTAMPNEKGKWMVELEPLQASAQGRDLIIKGKNSVTLNDILVGEVWLASGQSNMEWTFAQSNKQEFEYAKTFADNKNIRFFHVEHHLQAGTPMDDTLGRWKLPAEFIKHSHMVSAVGFYFAAKLHNELNVPIGILDANWGGMRIDNFISEEGYKSQNLPLRKHHQNNDPNVRLNKLKRMRDSIDHAITLAEKGITTSILEDRVNGWAENIIYNAMIAPLTPYAIKGAIWYQGESNRTDNKYFEKLKALSYGWSKAFRVKDIPLYQVQIAPFDYTRGQNPKDHTLGDNVWKAQYRGAKEILGVGIIPIHDTNINIKDIHPQHKRPVGERLADLALNKNYGKSNNASAPEFASAKSANGKVIVSFKNLKNSLTSFDGKPLTHFELSADGKNFVAAQAAIKGKTVEVTSASLPTPKYVRMGWSDIAIPNLCEKDGWPVYAFPAQEVK